MGIVLSMLAAVTARPDGRGDRRAGLSVVPVAVSLRRCKLDSLDQPCGNGERVRLEQQRTHRDKAREVGRQTDNAGFRDDEISARPCAATAKLGKALIYFRPCEFE